MHPRGRSDGFKAAVVETKHIAMTALIDTIYRFKCVDHGGKTFFGHSKRNKSVAEAKKYGGRMKVIFIRAEYQKELFIR